MVQLWEPIQASEANRIVPDKLQNPITAQFTGVQCGLVIQRKCGIVIRLPNLLYRLIPKSCADHLTKSNFMIPSFGQRHQLKIDICCTLWQHI